MLGTESAYNLHAMEREPRLDTELKAIQHSQSAEQQRGVKILAKSVYRQLCSSGYGQRDIVAFTSELLELMTTDIKDEVAARPKQRTQ
jgi:hypothetical protein